MVQLNIFKDFKSNFNVFFRFLIAKNVKFRLGPDFDLFLFFKLVSLVFISIGYY